MSLYEDILKTIDDMKELPICHKKKIFSVPYWCYDEFVDYFKGTNVEVIKIEKFERID